MSRIRRQIPIPELDGTGRDTDRIQCGWYDCDNPASSLYTMVECFQARGIRDHPELPRRPECPECRRVAFCSEQCRAYQLRSHRPGLFGKLPPGVNPRIFLT